MKRIVFFFFIFTAPLALSAAARGGAGTPSALHRAARMLLSPFSAEKASVPEEKSFTSIAPESTPVSSMRLRPTAPSPARYIIHKEKQTPTHSTSTGLFAISASSPTSLSLPLCAPARNVTVYVYHDRKSFKSPIREISTVASFEEIELSYRETLHEFAERLLALTLQKSGFKGFMTYKTLDIKIEGYAPGKSDQLWQEALFTTPFSEAHILKATEFRSALLKTHKKIAVESVLPPPTASKTISLILAQPY